MKAFCLKCRREIEIKYPQNVETRNGRPAIGGLCSCCGTRVFKIGRVQTPARTKLFSLSAEMP